MMTPVATVSVAIPNGRPRGLFALGFLGRDALGGAGSPRGRRGRLTLLEGGRRWKPEGCWC